MLTRRQVRSLRSELQRAQARRQRGTKHGSSCRKSFTPRSRSSIQGRIMLSVLRVRCKDCPKMTPSLWPPPTTQITASTTTTAFEASPFHYRCANIMPHLYSFTLISLSPSLKLYSAHSPRIRTQVHGLASEKGICSTSQSQASLTSSSRKVSRPTRLQLLRNDFVDGRTAMMGREQCLALPTKPKVALSSAGALQELASRICSKVLRCTSSSLNSDVWSWPRRTANAMPW